MDCARAMKQKKIEPQESYASMCKYVNLSMYLSVCDRWTDINLCLSYIYIYMCVYIYIHKVLFFNVCIYLFVYLFMYS